VESSVRQLESVMAATQSMGFLVAMYIIADTSWLTLPPVWFGPAVHSPA
jgi:hypothetical protein